MNRVKDFTDLLAWQNAHELALGLYKISQQFPKSETYGIVDQLRRAAVSVTLNIAEGFGRFHFKDKVRFYYLSRGSLKEVQSLLILVKDLKYINNERYHDLFTQSVVTEQLLNGLIRVNKNN